MRHCFRDSTPPPISLAAWWLIRSPKAKYALGLALLSCWYTMTASLVWKQQQYSAHKPITVPCKPNPLGLRGWGWDLLLHYGESPTTPCLRWSAVTFAPLSPLDLRYSFVTFCTPNSVFGVHVDFESPVWPLLYSQRVALGTHRQTLFAHPIDTPSDPGLR